MPREPVNVEPVIALDGDKAGLRAAYRVIDLALPLLEAGDPMGLRLCGLHALDSCRIEKAFRHFGHDITDEDHVLEAGLGFAVKTGKPGFIGRDAVLRKREAGLDRRLVQFRLAQPDAFVFHTEVIRRDGVPVSIVTIVEHFGDVIAIGNVVKKVDANGTDIDQNLLGHPGAIRRFAKVMGERRRHVAFGIATGRTLRRALHPAHTRRPRPARPATWARETIEKYCDCWSERSSITAISASRMSAYDRPVARKSNAARIASSPPRSRAVRTSRSRTPGSPAPGHGATTATPRW